MIVVQSGTSVGSHVSKAGRSKVKTKQWRLGYGCSARQNCSCELQHLAAEFFQKTSGPDSLFQMLGI